MWPKWKKALQEMIAAKETYDAECARHGEDSAQGRIMIRRYDRQDGGLRLLQPARASICSSLSFLALQVGFDQGGHVADFGHCYAQLLFGTAERFGPKLDFESILDVDARYFSPASLDDTNGHCSAMYIPVFDQC
jgi:hypothetical protein